MIHIDVDAVGVDGFLRRLDGLATDYSDPIEEGLLYMLDSTLEKFENETDGFQKWAQLSEQRIKERGGDAHPILRDTGRLAASITPGPGNADSVFQVSNLLGVVGTRTEYAEDHQLGIGTPKRAFLTITPDDEIGIVEIFENYVKDVLADV